MFPRIKPKVLFVCIGNSCRSQMAQGYARAQGGDKLESFSAGSRPAGFVAEKAVQVMKEAGIDISKNNSKGLSQIPQEKYDAVVTMGCFDACPQIPARRRLDWQIPDPIGHDEETFRNVRDQIARQVHKLVDEILSDTASQAKP